MSSGAPKRALVVFLVAGLAGAAVALHVPACPMASLFGVPCPGCGLTRATMAALHGDFSGALHFHPLVFVMTPLVGWIAAKAALEYISGPKPPARFEPSPPVDRVRIRLVNLAASALLVALLGVWGLRFFGYFGGPVPVHRLIP